MPVDHHQRRHQQPRGQQAVGRRAVLVELAERLREQPVARRSHRDLALQQDPAIERAQAGDHRPGSHQVVAPVAHQDPRRVGERRGGAGQHLRRHQALHRSDREDVEGRRGQRAEQGRTGNGAARILDVVGRHGGRLQADERPQGQRRGGGDRLGIAHVRQLAARRDRQVLGIEVEPAEDTDQQQRQQLEDGQQVLHHAEGADASQVDQGAQPDRGDGHADHQQRIRQRRDEYPQVADQGHGDRRVADPGGFPVGPGAQVAGEAAETVAGIGVGAAGAGVDPRQAGEGQRQQHRAGARHQPAEQAEPAERRQAGGKQEDSRTDHVADHQRAAGPEPHAALAGLLSPRHRHPLACRPHSFMHSTV